MINSDTIPVFLSCDDNYACHLAATIMSVAKNSESKFTFTILHSGLNNFSIEKIRESGAGNEVVFAKIDAEAFKTFDVKLEHLSIAACFRYLIADMFENIDKAIYLDCDVIALEDLSKLYATNLEDCYAGVVDDVIKKSYPEKLGIGRYFNSGVMLLNTKKMREDKIPAKLFEKTAELSGQVKYLDQDILNIVLQGKLKFLDLRWNATASIFRKKTAMVHHTQEEVLAATYSPALIHFTGPDKPWVIPYGVTAHPWSPAYLYYLKQTPFAKEAGIIIANFKPLSKFFWYWKRRLLFFIRPHFFKMRLLYFKNIKRFGA